LKKIYDGPLELENMRALAVDIMRRVYQLIGVDYHFEPAAAEEEA
jgi:hypothetical protein